MNFAVIIFPGSNCDHDCEHVVQTVLQKRVTSVWHKEKEIPAGTDCVILPGGFSYGDYLRAGAMARFSPIMRAVMKFADGGGLVLGICNGFQILTETGLLPGALMRNDKLKFVCKTVSVRVERTDTPFTALYEKGEVLALPIAHMDGNYFIDEEALSQLNSREQVVFRYCDEAGKITSDSNPNGSLEAIAGICNREGNVLGLMPHPERASEKILGSEAGLKIFKSLLYWRKEKLSETNKSPKSRRQGAPHILG